jgi:hypothetical protein
MFRTEPTSEISNNLNFTPISVNAYLTSKHIIDYTSGEEKKNHPIHSTVRTILGEDMFKNQPENSPIVGALLNNKIFGFVSFL